MKTNTGLICLLLLFGGLSRAAPLGTAFTYQGELKHMTSLANGQFDFQFAMFDVESGGLQIVAPVLRDNVDVADGVFTVELDFTAEPFAGDQLWLEIGVRVSAIGGVYTGLLPRQKITAVPYALHAEFVAMNAVGSAEVDSTEVQLRIGNNCVAGSSIRAIAANGTVTCESDDVGLTVVTGDEIVDGTVTADDLAADSVDSSELVDGSVDNAHLAGSIAPGKIAGTAAVRTFASSQSFDNGLLFLDPLAKEVGINTITPGFSLDVNGAFRVTGDAASGGEFTYTSAKTYTHTIAPTAFRATYTSDPTDYHVYDLFGGYGFARKSTAVFVTAPVNLPDGVTVTEVRCYWYDARVADWTGLDFRLYRNSLGSTNNEVMASASASSLTLMSHNTNAVESFAATDINPAVINNSTNYYHIRMVLNYDVSPCSNSCLLRFYGCSINYDLSRVSAP